MQTIKVSPLMQQYFTIKPQYPDALLLFQVGDFYELFFEDAKIVAQQLSITLTKRGQHLGQDIPLCGIPCHNLGYHLVKLVNNGFKVAICEQIEKARPGNLVARQVTKLFTPGTLTEQGMLQDKKPSYLCALSQEQGVLGLLFVELLTFQAFATCLPSGQLRLLENEVVRFLPDEVILESAKATTELSQFFAARGFPVSFSQHHLAQNGNKSLFTATTELDAWQGEALNQWFDRQFTGQVAQRLQQTPALARSVGSLARFLAKHNRGALDQIQDISFYEPEDFLILDAATQQNLELLESSQGNKKHSLFAVIDRAQTAMGSRTLKKWLQKPLVDEPAINARLDVVTFFAEQLSSQMQLQDSLAQIADLERIIGRIVLDRALVADFLLLKETLRLLPEIKNILTPLKKYELGARLNDQLQPLPAMWQLLEAAINDSVGPQQTPIKKGFNAELDRLRELVFGGQQQILAMEMRQIQATGINSLKIREHEFYGFAIEVTKANIHLVPADYQLQQTLVGKNRYVNAELKNLERDIAQARAQIDDVEAQVFKMVKEQVVKELHALRSNAQALATLDALLSLAEVAANNNYCRPQFNDQQQLAIVGGRHAMVEQSPQMRFVPNDTNLTLEQPLWIITGPNMGGKSTYLRQVALIAILAQIGSFVPAKKASLSLFDRIFTRIGAGDNLAAGKSTFLVEMEEAATICRQATAKSLVILDEVGRGTSTFDGMAIAQAIIEFLVTHLRPRCLFATHYHELTDLASTMPAIANYMLGYQKTAAGLVFLHQLAPGCATGSFGVEVARLAELPNSVIVRAKQLVAVHEALAQRNLSNSVNSNAAFGAGIIDTQLQARLQQLEMLLQRLQHKHPDEMSPREAHALLVWLAEQNIN